MSIWVSWNENIKHEYNNLYHPKTMEEIADIVKNSRKVKVIGTGRSSSDIVGGEDTLISLDQYKEVVNFDKEKGLITVQSGIMLSDLIPLIEKEGWCLPCLPDIDVITLGGAIATGTHGTGKDGYILSQYMIGCHMIKANGQIEEVKDEDLLEALRVSVGVLGIMGEITLQLTALYDLVVTEAPMKDKVWLSKWQTWVREYDFLRILYLPHVGYSYVMRGNKDITNISVKTKTGPWYYRYRRELSRKLYNKALKKPSFTVFANKLIAFLFFRSKQVKKGSLYEATVTKSRGSTLELAEWTIPFSRFDGAFKEIQEALSDKKNAKAFAHIPMDVRFINKDNNWLSYAYGEDTVTIGCVTRQAAHADEYKAFEVVEDIFLRHGARPHWAKRFKAGKQELAGLYPKWNDFVNLRRQYDKEGKFLNQYLERIFL
ncbi:D-arabinono-1,4-lactone oxidase [Spirochaeta cellobiosiphila]|uniref:D-arabinono-1,4-lactone oxidase n=1 Tax=Spirochaeta cellobiosiphila TaxID=504483 RepID=UPI0004140B9E|nr:D-arabinono-1,4-lactone oxidase [Spirochaeta cellobiosiphila]